MPDIHWTQPDFQAVPETDGHGDTCGIDAMLAYLGIAKNMPRVLSQVDAMRNELIGLNLFDHGMTMVAIRDAFHHYGIQEVKFQDENGSLSFAQFHQDLIDALTNHQCVLMMTRNAQALPGNQQNVFLHFVTFWGIDSNLGYYCANGDLMSDFNPWQTTPQTPVWYGVGALAASNPLGYIVLPAISEVNPVIILEQSNGHITGAYDADNPSLRLGEGFAKLAQQQNLLADEITTGETTVNTAHIDMSVPGAADHVQVAVIGHRYLATWTQNSDAILRDWSQAAQVIEELLSTPRPTIDNDSAVANALATVSQSAASVATSVAELQKDIASLEIAQTADK